jgi:transposase
MSLKPEEIGLIPQETIQIAQAAFPKGSLCMRIRNELGTIFEDEGFATLFPKRGQPALAPWRLALVTILQFLENLSDRQAADMVRSRIDWKYLLGLELRDSGFDFSVLSEFRTRLIEGRAEQLLLDKLLDRFKALKLLKAGGRQRTDSTHLLAAVRQLNRLEFMGETLRSALNALATADPVWLRSQLEPDIRLNWVERYGVRVEDYRLPQKPQERQEHACVIGQDGFQLLETLWAHDTPAQLRELEAIKVLREVWLHQYSRDGDQVQWRDPKELAPTGSLISSPYDPQAHYGNKRSKQWLGYKVHLSESCDEQAPRLITNVQTTPATVLDVEMLEPIQHALAAKELLPTQHLVDAGYPDAQSLVNSQVQYQLEVIGPVAVSQRWQAREGPGYSADQFTIDWSLQRVSCPQGQLNKSWSHSQDGNGNELIYVLFDRQTCHACPARSLCTRSVTGGRGLSLRPQAQHEALQAARLRQTSPQFKEQYKLRAGVEGNFSQGERICGMRQCRYIGLAKTHLQQVASATAMNIIRALNWLEGKPLAKTRKSSFARLALAG